jgi:hypothetical protein
VCAIAERFFAKTRWRPTETKVVAGALMYSRYWWWTRRIMRDIAAKAHGDTDTSRDFEYTDWADLAAFIRRFVANIRHLPPARLASQAAGFLAPIVKSLSLNPGSEHWPRILFGLTAPGFAVIGPGLAFTSGEYHVTRSSVISIVLALAVGLHATLLCATRCHAPVADAVECQHEDSDIASLSSNEICDGVQVRTMALLREGLRRSEVVPDGLANPIVQDQFANTTAFDRHVSRQETEWSLAKRTLTAPLRI